MNGLIRFYSALIHIKQKSKCSNLISQVTMKFTHVLYRHNQYRLLRKLWFFKSERTIPISPVERKLTSNNIQIKDALELLNPPKIHEKVHVEFLVPRVTFDNTHPDWKDRICWTYKDHNVLQAGTTQALLLTKTAQKSDKLPDKINSLAIDHPDEINDLVKRSIYTSAIFDAEQKKLPKIKDPERLFWNFPRIYGITCIRKAQNITNKLLQLCESLCGPDITRDRILVHDGKISFLLEKEEDLLQFALRMDIIVMSKKAIEPLAGVNESINLELPDIYPLHHIISLEKANIYKNEFLYPLDNVEYNVHTIFVHHDTEEVKNLTELPVQDDQIQARSLVKSFTAAVGYARSKYGPNVKELQKPIVVQCIQSNGCNFHFSVFQLNTLDIDGKDGIKNLWWSLPTLKLYERAEYELGRPVVEGYNPEVFKMIYAFYANN